MRLSFVCQTAYRECDARVTLAWCKKNNIDFHKRLPSVDKIRCMEETGLSATSIRNGLADLRKSNEV